MLHPSLQKNLFLLKEQVAVLKARKDYDFIDPETKQLVLKCQEAKPKIGMSLLRFSDYRSMTPLSLSLRLADGTEWLRIQRGWAVLNRPLRVLDAEGKLVGSIRKRRWRMGGCLEVCDAEGQLLFEAKGDWLRRAFRMEKHEKLLAELTKQWSGIGRELLSNADDYMLRIAADVGHDSALRKLIFPTAVCLDLIFRD